MKTAKRFLPTALPECEISIIGAAMAIRAKVIAAGANMQCGMGIIAQASAMRSTVPAPTTSASCVRGGNRSQAHADGENRRVEFYHVQISQFKDASPHGCDLARAVGQYNLKSMKNRPRCDRGHESIRGSDDCAEHHSSAQGSPLKNIVANEITRQE